MGVGGRLSCSDLMMEQARRKKIPFSFCLDPKWEKRNAFNDTGPSFCVEREFAILFKSSVCPAVTNVLMSSFDVCVDVRVLRLRVRVEKKRISTRNAVVVVHSCSSRRHELYI